MLTSPPLLPLPPSRLAHRRHGLRDIVKRLGVTTVIVTHDQEEAWDIADQARRVCVWRAGGEGRAGPG